MLASCCRVFTFSSAFVFSFELFFSCQRNCANKFRSLLKSVFCSVETHTPLSIATWTRRCRLRTSTGTSSQQSHVTENLAWDFARASLLLTATIFPDLASIHGIHLRTAEDTPFHFMAEVGGHPRGVLAPLSIFTDQGLCPASTPWVLGLPLRVDVSHLLGFQVHPLVPSIRWVSVTPVFAVHPSTCPLALQCVWSACRVPLICDDL